MNFIQEAGGPISSWYVGITSEAVRRLFIEHNVQRETDQWIYKTAFNADEAREIEQFFIARGMDGAPGGGDESAKVVYVYRINPYIKQ